ncbi:alpha/beta hydrolase [Maribacter algarum]|uniref:Alpha/beta hydrolase n=1 Tax=Maribacter algarum (ex Zhang et al. 2020) TaxID=2578118 RepID=A0A5S3PRL5_9FLAO|nr:alpha/beta hydrolase [Maribacter algarum]TMM57380.1 alpha/beta hydrolase [Maribacter algarum]
MRRLKKIGIVLGVLYLLLVVSIYFFQERLIFFPSKMPMQHEYEFCQPFEEFFLETKDGAKLNAVHIQNNSSKGVALYFHGNSGNVSHLGHVANLLTSKGYDAILVDYRTYGKSTGELSEEALNADAQLFYEYATKQYDENEIVLYGRSFGTGIASRLAAKNNPCRLILESPFSSAVDLGNHRFPILPVSWLSEFRFPSTEYMKEVKCPIYIFHGTDDKVIPYKFAQKLYESIPGDGKKFYTIEGVGHNYLQDYEVFKTGMNEALK